MIGVLSIVFICVSVNHLGLVEAIQRIIKHNVPIVNCSKCLTFWVSLIFLFGKTDLVNIMFLSLLAAYLSLWVELAMGIIDKFYVRLYEKIFGETYFDEAGGDKSTKSPLPEV